MKISGRLLENALLSFPNGITTKYEIEQDSQHAMICVKSYFQTHSSQFIMQKVFSLVHPFIQKATEHERCLCAAQVDV